MKHWEISAYKDPKLEISISADTKTPEKDLRYLAWSYGYKLPKKIKYIKLKGKYILEILMEQTTRE